MCGGLLLLVPLATAERLLELTFC